MSKKVYQGIKEGLEQAIAFANGTGKRSAYRVHIPADMDVRAIRKSTGLTQQQFAELFGFNLGRLRDLEQGRTHPDSVVRAYLLVIKKRPDAVREALAA
jgi:putative transcriptional regulator